MKEVYKNRLMKPSSKPHDEEAVAIYSVGFSVDGTQIYTSDLTSAVCIYNAMDGQLIKRFSEHGCGICWIAISLDGKYLATGARDNKIRLFDFASGTLLRNMKTHTSWVWGVEFSPGSEYLYSASRDRTIAKWSIPDGRLLLKKELHDDEINGLAIAPGGKMLATVSDDHTVRIWDDSLSPIKTFVGHSAIVNRVRFLSEGAYLASSDAGGNVILWSFDSGKIINSFHDHGTEKGLNKDVWGLGASLGNDYFVSAGTDGLVIVRHAPTGEIVARFYVYDNISSAAFNDKYGCIVVGCVSGSVISWQLGQVNSRRQIQVGKPQAVIIASCGPYKALGLTNGKDDYGKWLPQVGAPKSDKRVTYRIVDAQSNREFLIDDQRHLKIKDIIVQSLDSFGLPQFDGKGRRLTYVLRYRGCYLNKDEFLASVDMPDGERIYLVKIDDEIGACFGRVVKDRVNFTIASPPFVQQGSSFTVDVWLHTEHQRSEVIKRVYEAAPEANIQIRAKGPVRVERGTILSVFLRIDGMVIKDPEDMILWDADISNTSFLVEVPKDASKGVKSGIAIIYTNSLQVARVNFIIHVGETSSHICNLTTRQERYRKAFASYASTDRNDVLARIQGIQKIVPEMDIFLDVLSFRSGQYWEQQLWKLIPQYDVFYLFWSRDAAKSEWVEKEWRCALATRGLDFIDPIPLVSPEETPPPDELSGKHFNDWTLAYVRSKKSRNSA